MKTFTFVIRWLNDKHRFNVLQGQTLPAIIQRLQDVHDTAGGDLIENILIVPDGTKFPLGREFEFNLDGEVSLADNRTKPTRNENWDGFGDFLRELPEDKPPRIKKS